MLDDEDGLAARKAKPKVNFDAMSVAELEAHIAELKLALEEARDVVERKRRYREGLDELFGN